MDLEKKAQRLFGVHVAAATLHGLQAIAATIVLARTSADEGRFRLTHRVYDRSVSSVTAQHIKYMVPIFPALSMINHVVSAVQLRPGTNQIKNAERALSEPNVVRWSEYAVSAGLMFWIVAQLSGMTDAPFLFVVLMLNVSMQFCGYMIERSGDPRFSFTVIGWISFVSLWVPIMWYFFRALDYANDEEGEGTEVPGTVYAIIFVQFALFSSFGIASLYFRKRREPRDVYRREITYATLSIVSKSLLTWLVVGGALNAGVD